MSAEARKIAALLLGRTLPSLKPSGVYNLSLVPRIEALPDSIPIRSILHLLNDDIARAHNLAQSDDGNLTSSYVHQQLHRREGDYWNSKWWLESGMHSVHPVLINIHGGIIQGKAFVDACEAAGPHKDAELEGKQWDELKATLYYALESEK